MSGLKERSPDQTHSCYRYLDTIIDWYFHNPEKFGSGGGVTIEIIGKNKRVEVEAPVGGGKLVLFKSRRSIRLSIENPDLGETINWIIYPDGPRKRNGSSLAKPLFSDHQVPAVWFQDLRKLDEVRRQQAIADFETTIKRVQQAFAPRLPSLS